MTKKIQWTVEMADKEIGKWEKIKAIIKRSEIINDDDDLHTKVFKLYLKHTSVANVAKQLSEEGVRITSTTGTRKLISNDVTKIIKSEDIADAELQELVRSIHKDATKIINYPYN